ncbi:MAG: major facilitator superfamily oxalate/formate antiporter [Candidatus Kaiserbacteria bacterium]|nr:major facilitator superfamily oxalate/formate antiporter [Candidatus Kaiserbacteria bacterium]
MSSFASRGSDPAAGSAPVSRATSWFQISVGALCMFVPGVLLYGWGAFVESIMQGNGWSNPQVQTAFWIFGIFEACFMWLQGPIVDRWGPRIAMIIAGVLVAFGGYLNSTATTLTMLYTAAAFSGFGASIVTCATIGNAAQWFPDKDRGLAAGVTVMGFALGAGVTILPMVEYIKAHGYRETFLIWGVLMGLALAVLALLMRAPREGEVLRVTKHAITKHQYTSWEMFQTKPFWMLLVMFGSVAATGLLVTSQLGPIMTHYKTHGLTVGTLLGYTFTGFTLALFVDRVANILCRPVFGWLSDIWGRERTMAFAFLFEAIGIFLLFQSVNHPLMFSFLSGLVFLAFGEIYALMPATLTDIYGEKHAATNYGWLYVAKAFGYAWAPISGAMFVAMQDWQWVFYVNATLDILAAVLAFRLIPARREMRYP